MVYYTGPKPRVYIETTVVSYLVARQSPDATLASWQQATRQLWESYADRFEFVVSTELIKEFEMKEVIEDYTDPILEECLRMKAEFNAQFNSMEELSAYLKLENEKFKKQGWKYVSYYKPPKHSGKDT